MDNNMGSSSNGDWGSHSNQFQRGQILADTSGNCLNENRIHIRTPPITPDVQIQDFDNKLSESITLLKQYHKLLEQNSIVEKQLASAKETTINTLIKQLVQRKQDQDVARKCIEILIKVKNEYRDVQKRMAEEYLVASKVLLVDQSTQCHMSNNEKSTVGTSTDDHIGTTKSPCQQALYSKCKVAEIKSADLLSKERIIEEPESCSKNGAKSVSSNNDAVDMHGQLDNIKTKSVRFSSDCTLHSAEDIHGQQKRKPLQTSPINIFGQIIPPQILDGTATEVQKSEVPHTSNGKPSSKLRAKFQPPFQKSTTAIKLLSKTELQKIYKHPHIRSVKSPNSGDETRPKDTASESSVLPDGDGGGKIKINETETGNANSDSTKISTTNVKLPKSNREDFTPYDIPMFSRRPRKSILVENTCNTTEFHKQISSTGKNGSGKRRNTNTKTLKKTSKEGLNRKKPQEYSSSGKRLTQTVLCFQRLEEIEEFSTSTSDIESMIQEDTHLAVQKVLTPVVIAEDSQ